MHVIQRTESEGEDVSSLEKTVAVDLDAGGLEHSDAEYCRESIDSVRRKLSVAIGQWRDPVIQWLANCV